MAHNAAASGSQQPRSSTAQSKDDEGYGLALFRSTYCKVVGKICGPPNARQISNALWYIGVQPEDREIFFNQAMRQIKAPGTVTSEFKDHHRRIMINVLTERKMLEACAFDFFYTYHPDGFEATTKKRKRHDTMAVVAERWLQGSNEAKEGMFRIAKNVDKSPAKISEFSAFCFCGCPSNVEWKPANIIKSSRC